MVGLDGDLYDGSFVIRSHEMSRPMSILVPLKDPDSWRFTQSHLLGNSGSSPGNGRSRSSGGRGTH